ncbi:unnamed protein product [Allacma fusca]|uniref:Uncharacterized protein n=1 Tax=Allacma fusca TaxID=39272 RepID=A0A8J2LS26_9HEXA|nr:unnamed protein product [Allacma fusca]
MLVYVKSAPLIDYKASVTENGTFTNTANELELHFSQETSENDVLGTHILKHQVSSLEFNDQNRIKLRQKTEQNFKDQVMGRPLKKRKCWSCELEQAFSHVFGRQVYGNFYMKF